jgi:hypothetical protein
VLSLDKNAVFTIAFQVVSADDATRKLTPDQVVVRFYNAAKEELSFAATAAAAATGSYTVEVVRAPSLAVRPARSHALFFRLPWRHTQRRYTPRQ